ncbi:hypothetical protein ABK040_005635 [Willaertia magna]
MKESIGRNINRLLSFLLNAKRIKEEEIYYKINLPLQNPFFQLFFEKNKNNLQNNFHSYQLRLLEEHNSDDQTILILQHCDNNKIVSIKFINQFIQTLQNTIEQNNIFNYTELNINNIHASIETLQFLQNKIIKKEILDTNKLDNIKIEQIYYSKDNLEFSEHQWNYSATSAGIIYFPNANEFYKEHFEHWREEMIIGERIEEEEEEVIEDNVLHFRDYEFRSFLVNFHEIIHCFQKHKWQFKTFNLLKAEFEASFAQLNLFLLSTQIFTKRKDFYLEGLFEECILWLYEFINNLHRQILKKSKINNKYKQLLDGYNIWLQSHGRDSKILQDLMTDDYLFEKKFNSYLKCRLPLEVFYFSLKSGIAYDFEKNISFIVKYLKFHFNGFEEALVDLENVEIPKEFIITKDIQEEIFKTNI